LVGPPVLGDETLWAEVDDLGSKDLPRFVITSALHRRLSLSFHNKSFRRFVMDGATIFVLILAVAFVGFIAFLSIKSRRNGAAHQVKPEDGKPRKAA
jgi:hypothetical protein